MENAGASGPSGASLGASSLADFVGALQRGEATPPSIASTIGFQPVSVERGRAVFEMDVDLTRHANPMGTLHGGVVCTLADTAMGMAYASTLSDRESFTTPVASATLPGPAAARRYAPQSPHRRSSAR